MLVSGSESGRSQPCKFDFRSGEALLRNAEDNIEARHVIYAIALTLEWLRGILASQCAHTTRRTEHPEGKEVNTACWPIRKPEAWSIRCYVDVCFGWIMFGFVMFGADGGGGVRERLCMCSALQRPPRFKDHPEAIVAAKISSGLVKRSWYEAQAR